MPALPIRGDVLLLIFGVLLLMSPQMFAYVAMSFVSVFEHAFGSSRSGGGENGEPAFTDWQEDVKAFKSQVVDPQKQFWGGDQFML